MSTNWTMTEPVWNISQNSGPLPPGLALNRFTGEVSGTPTEAGFWTVRFNVRDKTHGIDSDPRPWSEDALTYNWYYEDIELRIYDKLTE